MKSAGQIAYEASVGTRREIAKWLSTTQRDTLVRALPDGRLSKRAGDISALVMLGLCAPPDPSTNAVLLTPLGRAVAASLKDKDNE